VRGNERRGNNNFEPLHCGSGGSRRFCSMVYRMISIKALQENWKLQRRCRCMAVVEQRTTKDDQDEEEYGQDEKSSANCLSSASSKCIQWYGSR